MKYDFAAEGELVDFGAPSAYGAHLFRVEIPVGRTSEVEIIEAYGFDGSERGIPAEEARARLKREVWSGIAEVARKEFNARLKEAKLATSRWKTGPNRIDRILGKELCVLAWAAETATEAQVPIIAHKWAALRPEERWWLFAKTVAEAGLPEDKDRGWRKALFSALSDGEKAAERKKRPRPVERDLFSLDLEAEPATVRERPQKYKEKDLFQGAGR